MQEYPRRLPSSNYVRMHNMDPLRNPPSSKEHLLIKFHRKSN
ncbi:unnamed protein product, partial [Rotaria sordida]